MKRVAVLLVVCISALAVAQPDPTKPPSGDLGTGSQVAPDPWGGTGPGTGTGPATGSGRGPAPGSGTGPATGSGTGPGTGPGSGPATGSGTGPGSGTGSGSAAGSGSASGGPVIIQLPTDLNAPTVSAAASPTVVRLGGKFTVFITATFAAGVEVNLREPIELGSAFEVTRKLSEDKPTGDGRTTREWQLEVIAWELGDLVMPPIAVTYTTMGKADQVATNRVKLRVEGVLGDVVDDPKAMRGNAPPTDLLARDWFWLYVAIGVVVSLGTLISIIVLWRNGRRKRGFFVAGGVAAPRKFDSASDRALYKLKEIEKSGVLERDDDRKQGYAEMVEVIREYIGTRYRVATLDLTSSELVKKIAKLAPKTERDMIETWLGRCDIVKYGGLKAGLADANKTLEDARLLVITTTSLLQVPKAPEPPPPPPSDPTTSPPTGGPSPYDPKPRASSDDEAKTTPFVKEEAA